MTYSLPSYVVMGGAKHFLSFEIINGGKEWHACYKHVPVFSFGACEEFNVFAETFNGALKKLHAKIKKIQA